LSEFINIYILHLVLAGETLCAGCQWKRNSKTARGWYLPNIYLHSTKICRCYYVCIFPIFTAAEWILYNILFVP